MQAPTEITLAQPQTSADLEAAANVLAASFQNAPNFVAAFPGEQARARALPHVFRMLVRDAAPLGGVTVAVAQRDGQDSATLGAAVWFQPGQVLTLGRQLKLMPELAKTFFAAPASFVRFARLGGELAKRRPDEPHTYLAALGVSPTFSGQGVGSALMQEGTVQADRAQQRCYLETFSEQNVRFYKRHGFGVTGQDDDLIPGGPSFWFMTRLPGQA